MGCSFFDSNEETDLVDLEEQGDQQLTVLIGEVSDPLSAEVVRIFREAVVQFELDHPGVKVTIDTTTTQALYDDKLFPKEESQELPDIIVVSPNKLNKYAASNILAELSVYANNDNMPMSDFYMPLLEGASRNGEWITIPFSPTPLVIYYNKDWFDTANLPYPDPNWTWDDYAKTAQLLKASRASSDTVVFGGILVPDLFLLEQMVLSQGGSVISPDGKKVTGYLDSEASVKAVQFMIDFLNDQKLIEEMNPISMNSLDYLNLQKTGMIVSGSNALFFLEPQLGTKLGVASLPSFQGGARANFITMLGLSIMEQSDDKQLAWELLKLISIEQNEFTQQWSQWFLANNTPLAKSTGQDQDPFKTVMLDELNHVQRSALEQNEHYVTAFRRESMIYGMLNNLFSLQEAAEIKAQLTLIAQFIDEDMAKSEAASKQSNP